MRRQKLVRPHRRFCGVSEILPKMSRKYQAQECSLCSSEFLGRRHRHPDQSVVAFLKEEAGFCVGISESIRMCVCKACNVSTRQALKAREKDEPYQLRWLKDKKVSVCCVPSCISVRLVNMSLRRRSYAILWG